MQISMFLEPLPKNKWTANTKASIEWLTFAFLLTQAYSQFLFLFLLLLTIYPKFSGLKQYKYITLWFRRSELKNGIYLKSRCQKNYVFSGGFRAESILCLFQFLEATYILWFVAPSSIFKTSNSRLLSNSDPPASLSPL